MILKHIATLKKITQGRKCA